MNFVLDASAAAGWFLPDERTDYTEAIFEAVSGPDEALVPTLWAYEVRNIVLKGIRRGRVAPVVARPLLSALSQLRLRPVETRYDNSQQWPNDGEETVPLFILGGDLPGS